MFDLAVKHPGMSFFFSVDWIRYEDKLLAQTKSISVQEKPFVTRKVSAADYKHIAEKDDKALMCRYFNDILKEINDAERLPSVQEEMKAVEGEGYNRSRANPRDPVTGQFIKKENR
jgi:hypothetical protein